MHGVIRDKREREAQKAMSSSSPSVDALAVVASVREEVVVGKDAMDWEVLAREIRMGGGAGIMCNGDEGLAARRGKGLCVSGSGAGTCAAGGKMPSAGLALASNSGRSPGEVTGV